MLRDLLVAQSLRDEGEHVDLVTRRAQVVRKGRRVLLGVPDGGALRVVKLPYPRPVFMNGERLPASYANFYIANGVVMVPTFNDPNDRVAMSTLASLMPTRQIVGIHAVGGDPQHIVRLD